MPARTLLRIALVAILALAPFGCAGDDDAGTAPGPSQPGATPETALDCLGRPAADPTTFPPAPDVEIPRPDDRIVDLRGRARVEVPILDNVYEVRWFRVDPCTEIVFVNEGANPHNVVAAAEGAFATIEQNPLLEGPQTLVVAAPGDYPFYCSIHGSKTRGQTGFLVVGDG